MGQPADAGGDLERLLKELQAKGWSPDKLEALRERWEDVCHDPMRRGRGGKGIPENEPRPRPEQPPPPKPDLMDLFNKTVSWPGPRQENQSN
ncbi:MAG TPA: hypothetical protein VKL22_06685 [Actinomycetota bacterium]|nr:hypothetical protein [Actinomycetota bacterium]